MKLTILHRDQPIATAKAAYPVDEHFGKIYKRWYLKSVKKAKPYHWPRVSFKGQSEEYEEHILTGFK